MAELSPNAPSPAPSLSPTPAPTPYAHAPSLSPTPAPSPPAEVPMPPLVPETTPLPGIDDPFLVNLPDLDGLLNDSALFENPIPYSTSDVDHTFMFPFPDSQVQDPLPLDLSDCLSHCSPSLSPLSDMHTPLDSEQSPSQSHAINSPSMSLLSPIKWTVLHDHTYASSEHPLDLPPNRKKHKPSSNDSDLTATENTATPKKAKKETVKDDRYHVRRQKNNAASQVSRSKRTAHHKDLFSRVGELETANAQLREQVREMEAEARHLRENLVKKLSI